MTELQTKIRQVLPDTAENIRHRFNADREAIYEALVALESRGLVRVVCSLSETGGDGPRTWEKL